MAANINSGTTLHSTVSSLQTFLNQSAADGATTPEAVRNRAAAAIDR